MIFKIFKKDLKGLSRNILALAIALGLCLIPSLYAWFNIYSNWDPYANTASVQIAIVSEDEGVSIAFAIFFGISTRNRNVKKDTQDEAREDATILTKLENIQNTMIEVKSEMGSYRNEMKEIREYYIRASESLKQLHKRVDRIDKIIDESHPHQYIEE